MTLDATLEFNIWLVLQRPAWTWLTNKAINKAQYCNSGVTRNSNSAKCLPSHFTGDNNVYHLASLSTPYSDGFTVCS